MNWRAIVLASLVCTAARAQDISGTWQGADKTQHVVKIRKSSAGFRGDFYSLGEEQSGSPRNGNSISAIVLKDSAVKFSLDDVQGTFDGRLADDGKSMSGTWQTVFGAAPLTLARVADKDAWPLDPSPHKAGFVTVQKGVQLEVLDWGGKGPPLLFLSGLGNTAHVFDNFALKFTATHHVYGLTRRGFGASSTPPLTDNNYDADRLGDDVLAAIAVLKLNRPVVVGHSIAGEELSSIGSRHPEKVAGLIYLDATYQYSFYDPAQADLSVETATVKRDLGQMFELSNSPVRQRALIADLQSSLSNLQKALADTAAALAGATDGPAPEQMFEDLAGNRIFANTRRYGPLTVPVLAVVAEPRQCSRNCDKPFMQQINSADVARSAYFEKQSPNARVVRLAGAGHYVWRTNEADAEREMNAFMGRLH